MKKDTPAILQRKRDLIAAAITGRPNASAVSLSASFGLAVEEVRRILRNAGVKDDG